NRDFNRNFFHHHRRNFGHRRLHHHFVHNYLFHSHLDRRTFYHRRHHLHIRRRHPHIPPPPPPLREVASFTVILLPMNSVSFRLLIALTAESSSSKVTNAKPRGRPVSRSFIIATSATSPYALNSDRISSSLAS
uniref:Uncharacterized protein n=1 Tax=Ciona savignyi TaxID=51511 RepID=H2YSK3_CIOSA